MKKTMYLLLVITLTACTDQTVNTNQNINTEAYLEDSRKIAKSFMQKLGGSLKRQIKAGGVESAIPVCKEIAPAIANQYSQDGMLVKRVSTKARNKQQGTPDQWELTALETLEVAIQANKTDSLLEKAEITTENGTRYYRYAKAIRVKPVCLSCHGPLENLGTKVKAALAQHYPNDVATGYQLGDLRGAISIKHQLDF